MPTTTGVATSFITFSRASAASRVNSSGLIESVTTNTARLDFDPATLAPRGLLVEEQRTNLFLHSNDFSNAAWTKAGVSITSGAGTGLDGANSASKLVEAAAGGTHILVQTRTATASAAHSASLFVKAAERSRILFQLDDGAANGAQSSFNLSAGTAASPVIFGTGSAATSTIENFGNGWYRCTLRCIPATTGSSVRLIVYLLDNSGVASYTGNGTSGVLISNSQLEAGNFQTSYIATTTASVTRSADVASVATSQFPYNATEGTIVVKGIIFGPKDFGVFCELGDGTFNNRVSISMGGNGFVYQIVDASGSRVFSGGAMSSGANAIITAGIAAKENDFVSVLNNGTPVTDTTGAMPSAASSIFIGRPGIGAGQLNGWVRQITYLPRRLTNAQLQARTV